MYGEICSKSVDQGEGAGVSTHEDPNEECLVFYEINNARQLSLQQSLYST